MVLEVGLRLTGVDAGAGLATELGRALFPDDDGQAWMPLMLPVLLARGGFADVVVDTFETTSREPGDARAALRIDDALVEGLATGRFDRPTVDAWRRDLDAAGSEGTLRLEVRGILFRAIAPGGQSMFGSE